MNQFVSTQRKDLIPPCAKGCPDRTATCRDHCQKEEYLRWRELRQAMKDDNDFRREAKRIDGARHIKRKKTEAWKKGR